MKKDRGTSLKNETLNNSERMKKSVQVVEN